LQFEVLSGAKVCGGARLAFGLPTAVLVESERHPRRRLPLRHGRYRREPGGAWPIVRVREGS